MTDELSPRARAFLREVHDADDPTAEDFRRVHDAVRARVAVGVAAGAASLLSAKAAPAAVAAPTIASAAPTTLVAAGVGATLTTKIVAAVLVVGAVAGGTTTALRASRPAAPIAAQAPELAVVAPPAAGPVARRAATAAPVDSPAAREVPAIPATVPSPGAAPRARNALAAPPAPPVAMPTVPAVPAANPPPGAALPADTVSPLDAEIAMLRDARAALRGGDGGRALLLLDQHDRQFPAGALGEDAAAERIFALCAMGRTADASALAAAFLARHPASPYAATVRSSCGLAGAK